MEQTPSPPERRGARWLAVFRRAFSAQRLFRHVGPVQWLVDGLVVVLFLFTAVAFSPSLAAELGFNYPGLLVNGLVMTAALAISRWTPTLSLALAWAGAIAQMLMQLPWTGANLAIFVVLFACAAYGSRTLFWVGLVSAALGALIAALYLVVFPPAPVQEWWGTPTYTISGVTVATAWFFFVFGFLLVCLVLAWTFGALFRVVVRGRETRRAQALAEERAAAELERGRIARDMHDIVAHSLAVVIAQADGARYAAATDAQAAEQSLLTISQTARSALADVRLLLTQMRHQQGDGPQPTIADLDELYEQVRAAGVDLRVTVHPTPPGEPPTAVQIAVYRIMQEATTNALRHGDGGPVDVAVAWLPDAVSVFVRNGRRAAPRGTNTGTGSILAPALSGGHGLIGMRERAELVGGRFTAGAQDDAWVVQAWLPVGGPR